MSNLRVKTVNGGHKLSDEAYNAMWLRRMRGYAVVSESGCWLWPGWKNKVTGYGDTSYRGRGVRVHRKMYEVVHGVKLEPLQYVCHSCDVVACFNPDHLWVGTGKENQRDSVSKGRHSRIYRTHCPKGHPYDESNTYWYRTAIGTPSRHCRECARIRTRERWLTNREELTRRQRERRRSKGVSA